ncbi:MAG TPA: hypothetical protein VIV66_02060, partial [Pyrinomonadaceae bacterium]
AFRKGRRQSRTDLFPTDLMKGPFLQKFDPFSVESRIVWVSLRSPTVTKLRPFGIQDSRAISN